MNNASSLYSATGAIRKASIIRLCEGIINITLMLVLIPFLGTTGLPIATIVSATMILFIFLTLLKSKLDIKTNPNKNLILKFNYYIGFVLVISASIVGYYLFLSSWFSIITSGILITIFGIFLTYLLSPVIRNEFKDLNIFSKLKITR